MAGFIVPLAFTRTWYDPHPWYPRNAIAGFRGESLEDRGEVCLAEEVERLRLLGHSDGEIASSMGVDVGWVETLVSPGEDDPKPAD